MLDFSTLDVKSHYTFVLVSLSLLTLFTFSTHQAINDQCSQLIKTSQLICFANQFTVFLQKEHWYLMGLIWLFW